MDHHTGAPRPRPDGRPAARAGDLAARCGPGPGHRGPGDRRGPGSGPACAAATGNRRGGLVRGRTAAGIGLPGAVALSAGWGVARAAPAITSVSAMRRAACPRLAGIGARDHVALTFDD